MLWIAFLLLIGMLILVLLCCTRKRQKDEPPLDKGYVPWLGHALEFVDDTASFLARMKDKHGDIFTICIAGRYMTVVLDPNAFDAVLIDQVCLNFPRNRTKLVKKIFSLEMPGSTREALSDWLKEHLQDSNLSELSGLAKTHLQNLFPTEEHGGMSAEWRQEGLFSLSCRLLFRAGYATVFGGKDNVDSAYREFRQLEDLLVKMARGSLGRGEKRTASSCLEKLWALLSPKWPSGGSAGSSWLGNYLHFLKSAGVGAEMETRALPLLLWTTQTNPGPAVFWLLGFLLTHPEAMDAVKTEIRGISSTLQTHSTPVLDSVLNETLRLTSGVLITRDVVQRKTLRLSSGQTYHLRQGDIVCLFPFLSPQMDPEIHQEPQSFIHNRFLNDDMTQKTQFYKDGKRVKYCSMPWGAGQRQCPGKEFALKFLKQFVLLFLSQVDVELCEPEAKLPPVNSKRYGFGILHPDGDLQVRYRKKRTQQGNALFN
ncbi:prostacyclin synthase [Genypterus blacodes]|uniref:prostacyclin synthase n=1 Tax=Genypterus blacodes TaxID=154954 RepID=UPI003F75BF15